MQRVLEMFDYSVTYGPYATDNMVYRSDRLVKYRTPPNTEGLGTIHSGLRPNDLPIDGVWRDHGDVDVRVGRLEVTGVDDGPAPF